MRLTVRSSRFLAGLWSERSGIVDIGGGKIGWRVRIRRGATFTGSVWMDFRGPPRLSFSLITATPRSTSANRIVSGTAINMVADSLTALI